MHFKSALYDGSDPLYAPGLSFTGKYASWRASKRCVEAGYSLKVVSLPNGHKEDEHQLERAQRCREYTREMMAWWEGQNESRPDFGTWAYVFSRYKGDEFSPINDVKGNTRESYLYHIARWEAAIGHLPLAALNFEKIKKIEAEMKKKGRSVSNIKRMFTMLRTVAKYGGYALEIPEVQKVSDMLSNAIRFKSPPRRAVLPTREQVYAIVEQADRAQQHAFAAGLILQYELSLRAVDVRGQWLEDDGKGGIVRDGKRWQDGLTWDMFDEDLTSFRKVISKTEGTMPEPYEFDLTALPDLRKRLIDLKPEEAVGPVIVTPRHGLPWDRHSWSRAFARFRKDAKVPAEIKSKDLRAGGITEASQMGADPYSLRNAAQHTQQTTTDIYVRGRSESANKVIKLRQTGTSSER